ncbi:RNA-directed DNA polymerase [Tanacetum coccineum]
MSGNEDHHRQGHRFAARGNMHDERDLAIAQDERTSSSGLRAQRALSNDNRRHPHAPPKTDSDPLRWLPLFCLVDKPDHIKTNPYGVSVSGESEFERCSYAELWRRGNEDKNKLCTLALSGKIAIGKKKTENNNSFARSYSRAHNMATGPVGSAPIQSEPPALIGAEFAYNRSNHSSTGRSPFFVVYGRNPFTPLDLAPMVGDGSVSAEGDERARQIQELHAQVREKIIKHNLQYQTRANKHRKQVELPGHYGVSDTFNVVDLSLYTPNADFDDDSGPSRFLEGEDDTDQRGSPLSPTQARPTESG